MTYTRTAFARAREAGSCAARDMSDLVPPVLYCAETDLQQCVQALGARLIDDWDDCIQYALDRVQEALDGIRSDIERAPGAVLVERADSYDEGDR